MPSINLLPQTVNVQSVSISRDASGGEVPSYSTAYTAVPCSIQPAKAKWVVQYQSRMINITHSVYFNKTPSQLSIVNGDRLIYGSRTFLVQGVRNLLEMNRELVVDVLEVT